MQTAQSSLTPDHFPDAIIVMGVSGCGKSSVGKALATALGYAYVEGDELHPQANIDKMSQGIALNDEDRWPWLSEIGRILSDSDRTIVTCSALKKTYRDHLRKSAGRTVAFVYLEGSRAVLQQRMGHREGHFMPLALLDSQLATLEPPTGEPGVVTVDIDRSVEEIVSIARAGLDNIGPAAGV